MKFPPWWGMDIFWNYTIRSNRTPLLPVIEFADLISSGKLFQSSGAATEKACLPYELRLK